TTTGRLVINAGGDFNDGVEVQSKLQVGGYMQVGGDIRVAVPGRTGGGRALVHWDDNSLRLNMENEFSGGTQVDSELRVPGDKGLKIGDWKLMTSAGNLVFKNGNAIFTMNTNGALVVGDISAGNININGIPLSNDSNWLSSGTFGYKTTGDISAVNINASNDLKGNYLYVGSTDGSKVIKRTAGTLIVGGDLGTDGKMNVNGIPLSNDSNWLSSGTWPTT
ncbi:hypothetical protein EBS40_06685, partial [bacterium]|nr:hypothetical protein [bacterium]